MRPASPPVDVQVDPAGILQASPNAYALIRPCLTVAWANPAYLELMRISQLDDIIGQPIPGLGSMHGPEAARDDRETIRFSLQHVFQTCKSHHLVLQHAIRPEGQAADAGADYLRLGSLSHTPVPGDDGSVRFVLQHMIPPVAATDASRRDAAFSQSAVKQALHPEVSSDDGEPGLRPELLEEVFRQAPGFVAILSGPEHIYQLSNDAHDELVGSRRVIGLTFREALPELADQGLLAVLDRVFETGEPFEGRKLRIDFRPSPLSVPRQMYLNFIFQPIRDPGGEVVGIFIQGHDVTASVLADRRQKLMIDELNHRVKNTLAIVQSIAVQTARSYRDPEPFAQAFQARVLALSHTHDLLTLNRWEGADLRTMLAHELGRYFADQVELSGAAVFLAPEVAVSLGMIFHELASNAVAYGALSTPGGRLRIDWTVTRNRGRVLELCWRESGGPKVAGPQRRGFGSRLIERNVRHDLAGKIELVYAAGGVVAELKVPLEERTA